METNNPYASPESPPTRPPAGPPIATLMKSVAAVFAIAAVGGVVGVIVGAALGVFAPDYYRAVISGGSQPGFNPVTVGVGLGLTQGILFGGGVGVALVALFYWYRVQVIKESARLRKE